jgi:hypothetical protein
MKKIFILFFLLVVGLTINANPIALPTIEISELYFDESDNWKLELGYYWVNQEGFPIDSIFIYSTTDTVKLPTYEFLGSTGVFVITLDSLDYDFIIKRYADTIKVVSFIMEEPFEDILIFGNISGASINYPRQGQSICKYSNYIVKDNSPTIGAINDTSGICGTLKGVVYDKYLEIVENRIFRLEDSYFESSTNGEYTVKVFSKPSVFNSIMYQPGLQGGIIKFASINELSYLMEPDSVVELGIHLLDTLTTGINDINAANTPISVYPNPISKNEELKIQIDLPIITSDIYVEIIDLNGKIIKKKKISRSSISIIAPDKSGFYIVRTMLDSEIISSNRIMVNE